MCKEIEGKPNRMMICQWVITTQQELAMSGKKALWVLRDGHLWMDKIIKT